MNTLYPPRQYPEDYNPPDYRYWQPARPLAASSRERPWVAKKVTIMCWQVSFDQVGVDNKTGDPVHKMIAFGYVKELHKYVPEGELKV